MPFQHRDLTGSDAVHPAWYVQATDPGAVGANKGWVDTSSGPPYQLKKRNSSNTAWENVGTSGSVTLFNDAEGNPADVVGTGVADGTSAFTAHRDHVHELGIISTRGDLIRGGVSGVPERVALGTNGQVLTSNGTDAVWAAASGGGGGSTISGGGSGALVPIQVIGPLTSTAASISVTPPTTGFRNLRIVLVGRGDTAATSTSLLMRFNNDSGANYDTQTGAFNANGGTPGQARTTAQTAGTVGNLTAANAVAQVSTTTEIVIPLYSDTTYHKTWLANSYSNPSASAAPQYDFSTGRWTNASAITTITLLPTAGNFNSGTYLCLYGEMDTAGVLLTPASNLLYEAVLTSTSATIDTGTLSSSYRDLRVVLYGRVDAAVTERIIRMRMNGDSSALYDGQILTSSGASPTSSSFDSTTSMDVGRFAGASAAANANSIIVIDIPNYTSTAGWKVTHANNAHSMGTSSGNRRTQQTTGQWRSTSAITNLSFTVDTSGSFIAGTAVRVYGEPISAGASSAGTGTRVRLSGNFTVADDTPSIIAWDTEDSDADNQHYNTGPGVALTGTLAKTAGSVTLTGTSTLFTTELSIGQVIMVPGTTNEKRVVTAIASNTSLTVNTAFANTASGQTGERRNSPIVFRQPGFYSIDAGIYWASDADGYRLIELLLNDTTVIAGDQRQAGAAIALPTTISASQQFQMWDFVEVRVRHTAGANLDVNADQRTFFSVNARPTVTVAVPYVSIQDQKASGTNGGTFTSGSWQTRTLNTIQSNDSGIASLASNQITLPAGVYRVQASAPAFKVTLHKTRLQNITASSTLLVGTAEYTDAAANSQSRSFLSGRFTLTATSAIELQHQGSATKTTDGFGVTAGFSATDVYSIVELWKEA